MPNPFERPIRWGCFRIEYRVVRRTDLPDSGLWSTTATGRDRKFEAEFDSGPSAASAGLVNGCCRRALRTGSPGQEASVTTVS
jgi:hypothetical protein